MNNSFWIILLAVGVYGIVHSILAASSAKAWARRVFGSGADRVYRLAYNVFAIVSIMPVFALIPILPDRTLYTIPFPWNLATLLGQALAGVLLVVGLLHTGVWSFIGVRQLSGAPDPNQGQLVVKGLYRWVRHPMYTVLFGYFVGLALVSASWLIAFLTAASIVVLYRRIGVEERMMSEQFGEEYEEYARRTGRLLPRLAPKPSDEFRG